MSFLNPSSSSKPSIFLRSSFLLGYGDEVLLLVFLSLVLLGLSLLLLIFIVFRNFWVRRQNTNPAEQQPRLSPPSTIIHVTESEGDRRDCVICLGNMQEENGQNSYYSDDGAECCCGGNRVLPRCGHEFHENCIDSWLATRPVCPICRSRVDDSGEGWLVGNPEEDRFFISAQHGLAAMAHRARFDVLSDSFFLF